MKAIRYVPFIFIIIAILSFSSMIICSDTAYASTLGSNLLSNSGAEAGNVSFWTDETGASRWFSADSSYRSTHSGSYAFCVQMFGGTLSAASLSQTVSISDQAALITTGKLVVSLSGWYRKSGTSPDRARLVLQELDSSGNVLGELGVYCVNSNQWEQGNINQAGHRVIKGPFDRRERILRQSCTF